EKQLLVLWIAERQVVWHHVGSQHAQPVDHLTRVVESPHMGIAGGQAPVGPWPRRRLLHRHAQRGCCLVEAAAGEVRDSQYPEVVADAVTWVEAERCLDLLDREIGLARPDTEAAPQHPRPREARIERERAIDQRDLSPHILAQPGECKRGVREDTWVVTG